MSDNTKVKNEYAYYSKVLKKVFESIDELKCAEAKHFEELKAKEDKAAARKADAAKVEEAFKAMNAARRTYKEELAQITSEYSKAMADIKKAFEVGKADIQSKLANAEEVYANALKYFTDKYDQYHLTLKDGDFETTVSNQSTITKTSKEESAGLSIDMLDLFKAFEQLFNLN